MNGEFPLHLDLQQVVVSDTIPDRDTIKNWIKTVLFEEAVQSGKSLNCDGEMLQYELTVRIVDKDEIRSLNKTYRHIDKFTNVLSFPFEMPPQIQLPLLGDVIICHDVVVEESHQQCKTIEQHWAHMVVHGVLHLMGYDHIDAAEAKLMESLEIRILDKLNISNPYL